jgi:hypothetical protein
MKTLFVVLITFMLHNGVETDTRQIDCQDQACVINILQHSKDSENISRIRVFDKNEFAPISAVDGSVYPPLLDLWFQ